jgi:hypothetical protein
MEAFLLYIEAEDTARERSYHEMIDRVPEALRTDIYPTGIIT